VQETLKLMREKFGFGEPNCFECIYYGGKAGDGITCNSPVALAIKRVSNTMRSVEGNERVPLAPVFTFVGEGVEELTVPGIIYDPAGVAFDALRWPESYNPVFILLCVMYDTEENTDKIED
jgi:hypothetical protein